MDSWMKSMKQLIGTFSMVVMLAGCAGARPASSFLESIRKLSNDIHSLAPNELAATLDASQADVPRRERAAWLHDGLSSAAGHYCFVKDFGRNTARLGTNPQPPRDSEESAFQKVIILVDAGADPNGPGISLPPQPISNAVSCDSIRLLRFLSEHGAKLNVRMPGGDTLLHVAACSSGKEVISYLIQQGLPVAQLNIRGETALEAARRCKNIAAVEVLSAQVDRAR